MLPSPSLTPHFALGLTEVAPELLQLQFKCGLPIAIVDMYRAVSLRISILVISPEMTCKTGQMSVRREVTNIQNSKALRPLGRRR